jgi:hypothetical protein
MLGALLGGCAAEAPRFEAARQIISDVARAERLPVELTDAQKQEVLKAVSKSPTGGARRFADPELNREVYASFWRSPITQQVDGSRLLLVRYFEDGSYVYVGFDRDGRLFTDSVGSIFADPPWAR